MGNDILYFAYGSNLFSPRLVKRVPSAKKVINGYLPEYVLRFNKVSKDGSGKGNIVKSGHAEDSVLGVIFKVPVIEKPRLDRAEGKGYGYNEIKVKVRTERGWVAAYTYIADQKAVDDSLRPYKWYLEYVIQGAKHHGFPVMYIQQLKSVKTKRDPDRKRREQNQNILIET